MMNKEKLEQWLLLRSSGELGPIRRWLLRRELHSHPEARRFQTELEGLTRAISRVREDAGPHPFVLNNILDEARNVSSAAAARQPSAGTEALAWLRPALAVAAVLAVIIAAWKMIPGQTDAPQLSHSTPTAQAPVNGQPAPASGLLSWDDGLDEELASLELTLASSDDWSLGDNGGSADSLDEMAKELLSLEGI